MGLMGINEVMFFLCVYSTENIHMVQFLVLYMVVSLEILARTHLIKIECESSE